MDKEQTEGIRGIGSGPKAGRKMSSSLPRGQQVRHSMNNRKASYRPPGAGANFNERLLANLRQQFSGDIRSQIALFCKHADFSVGNGADSTTMQIRFEVGGVLQACVTVLKKCGINLQNLTDLSPKNATTAARAWQKHGEADGEIVWRIAKLTQYFRMVGRRAPLHAPSASDY